MIRLGLTTAIIVGMGNPAFALSCIRPDPAVAFQTAVTSPNRFVIVHGSFAFDEALLKPGKTDDPNAPSYPPIPAQFTGKGLTLDGFTTDMDRTITLVPLCVGPWCGSIPADVSVLAFVAVNGGNYELTLDACSTTVFEASPENLALMASCLRGTGCAAN